MNGEMAIWMTEAFHNHQVCQYRNTDGTKAEFRVLDADGDEVAGPFKYKISAVKLALARSALMDIVNDDKLSKHDGDAVFTAIEALRTRMDSDQAAEASPASQAVPAETVPPPAAPQQTAVKAPDIDSSVPAEPVSPPPQADAAQEAPVPTKEASTPPPASEAASPPPESKVSAPAKDTSPPPVATDVPAAGEPAPTPASPEPAAAPDTAATT